MTKMIKKITIQILFIFTIFLVGMSDSKALEYNNFNQIIPNNVVIEDMNRLSESTLVLSGGGPGDCSELISGDSKAFLQKIFGYVKIFAPILVIVFGIIDFLKATVSQDNEALKKSGIKFFKRLAAAALLFIFPALIEFFLGIVKIKGVINYCTFQ